MAAQNASGVQLSELYLAFKEIEQQAKKVKIIRTSLYESLDPSTIKKVKAGVESSKIFKFTHKHQWGRITSALNYLLQFASQKTTETKTQETARVEMVESVKELEIVPSPDISSNALLKENIKSTKVTHIETEQDMDQSGAATTVNFHRINSMAFSKPVSLSYFGEVKPESSWKGLYVDACKSLLDDYPDIFTRLKAESLHGSGKTWLATAYLKLLFPNVRTASDVNPKEFMKYCLRPAIKMRKIIWRQLSILDAEYKNDDKLMPEFTLKEIRNEA